MSGTSKFNVSDTSTLFFSWAFKHSKQGIAKSRPTGQRPTARDGPATRRPSPDFPQFFCPAVNPRASTDLHWVWVCKTDGSNFEFVYHFNHLNPCFCLLHVVQIRTFSFSVHRDRGLFIIERCKLFSNHTVKTHNKEPKIKNLLA